MCPASTGIAHGLVTTDLSDELVTNDQGPTAATGDQALDLLLLV
jgi:hypothetical protein